MAVDRFHFERMLWQAGIRLMAGVDEAGRGPLAGPVVAAAVVFPGCWITGDLPEELAGLNDSKQLTERQRERFFSVLTEHPMVRSSVAIVGVEMIDTLNILRATHHAMNQALAALPTPPEHALVDGLHVATLDCPQTALVKGDARSYSIAAASVLAKVTRDRLMVEYDARYPAYGFAMHKGYGTPQHLAALAKHGPCPWHRRSFAPIKASQPELFPP